MKIEDTTGTVDAEARVAMKFVVAPRKGAANEELAA
jgi:hypothetical protein